MRRQILISIAAILGFSISAILIILFAKGYHFSPKTRTVQKTGLLVITSSPDGAEILIDGHLTDATNTTIKLVPGEYEVTVTKEGYTTWKKKLRVAGEFVTQANILLFPALPDLRPLTFTEVIHPVLSPDGQKLAYIVPATASPEKAGIWVWDMVSRALVFSRKDLKQIIKDTPQRKFSEAKISWTPDGKNLLAVFETPSAQGPEPERETTYLLDPNVSAANQKPLDVTATLALLEAEWEEEGKRQTQERLTRLPLKMRKIATQSAVVKWSPDETKFLYRETADSPAKVYDLKWEEFPPTPRASDLKPKADQKDQKLDTGERAKPVGKIFDLPPALDYLWLPEIKSRHVILVEEEAISIIESEGTNKMTIFGGEFEENFAAPWPDGSKLVILTSLNKPAGVPPSLYAINLR